MAGVVTIPRRLTEPASRLGDLRLRIPGCLWLTAAVLLAVVLRAAWIAYSEFRPLPDDDAYRYDFFARELAAGRGFVHLTGLPTAFWPPGYPVLLAGLFKAFGDSLRLAQAVNVVAAVAMVLLTWRLARLSFGRAAALPAAVMVAVWPALIFTTAVTLSETLFTCLLLLILVLLIEEGGGPRLRPWWLLAAGLVTGYAALVRGQALLLPLAAIPFWLLTARSWGRAGVRLVAVLAAALLVVLPWTARNWIQMGSPVLISTNGGVDLWIGNHPGANGRGQFADALLFAHPDLPPKEAEVRASEDGYRKAISFAVRHPATEVVLAFKKAYWLYYNDEEGLAWNEGHGGHPFLSANVRQGLSLLSNGYYFAMLGFLVLGLPLWFTWRHPVRLLLVSVLAYWTLVHLVFFGDPRFHIPVEPLIAVLASIPWAVLWGRWPPPRGVVVADTSE